MAKPRFCVCKSGGDPVYPVVEVRQVHDESDGDRTELHIRSPVAICQTCGGEILSRETRALLRIERKLGEFEERLKRIELGGAMPSANGGEPAQPAAPSNGAARLLTSAEVAEILRTTPRSINNWRRRGLLRAVPINDRHFGYRPEDVDEFKQTGGKPGGENRR